MATPVLIQNQYLSSSSSSTTTAAVTMTSQTAGDANIVCVTGHFISGATRTCSVSDGTHTYSTAVGPVIDSLSSSGVWIFYLTNIGSGTPTITATFSGAVAFPEILVMEWSNISTSSVVDATGSNYIPGIGSGNGTVSVTTTNANDLIITAFNNDANGWTAAGTGFTNVRVGSPGNCYDYQNVSSTGTYTDTPVAGGGSNSIWQAASAAFKAVSGAPVRPFSGGNLGNINVTGSVTIRLNPLRPTASGPVNVTGTVTPRFPGQNVAIVQHQPSFSLTASYANAQTAGNANIVFFSVNVAATISVSDSVNGAYTQLGSTQLAGVTWGIWYFFNIKAAAAGANTVTVTVSAGSFPGNLEILEVSGLQGTTDGYLGAGGFSTAVSTGNLSTTNADDVVLGFYGTGNTFSAYGAGWTGIDGTGTLGAEWQHPLVTGSFNATFTTTGGNNWGAAIGAFPTKAGSSAPLRPGPLSGSIVVTGSAALRPILRPGAIGTLGLTGRVNSPFRPGAIGTLGLSGAVHGRLNTPNQINVTGSIHPEFTLHFPSVGSLGLTARLLFELVGTERPLASGTILVTGTVFPRQSPFRPHASGSILVTGIVFPRYGFIRPPTTGTISLTALVAPRFILRPTASGLIRTSGGSTSPRLTYRPNASGTISITDTLLVPRFAATPGAIGLWGLTALVVPRQGGVARPFAAGTITVSGFVIPLFNPFRPFPSQFSTLTLNFSGIVTPEFFFPGRVLPPVFGSGWNVVAGVWGAYYTVLMVPGVNYNEIYSKVITPVSSQQAGIAYQIANGLY